MSVNWQEIEKAAIVHHIPSSPKKFGCLEYLHRPLVKKPLFMSAINSSLASSLNCFLPLMDSSRYLYFVVWNLNCWLSPMTSMAKNVNHLWKIWNPFYIYSRNMKTLTFYNLTYKSESTMSNQLKGSCLYEFLVALLVWMNHMENVRAYKSQHWKNAMKKKFNRWNFHLVSGYPNIFLTWTQR